MPAKAYGTNPAVGCSFGGQAFHSTPALPQGQAGTPRPPAAPGAGAQLGAGMLALAQGGHMAG